MPWVNYHSHTQYCDGSDAPELYVAKALELGMPAYGFSSHAPVNFVTEWCIADDKFSQYISDIQTIKEKYKEQIEIYLGLEIDFIPEVSGRRKHKLTEFEPDYFIGSIHFVDKFRDGTFWNIDTSADLFESGLKLLFNNNFRRAAERFFDLTEQMLYEEMPDVLGHFDKIKMFNKDNRYFREYEKWYQDRIDSLIGHIKKKGTIVEVNTRGYYKYNQPDLYPSQWIIERMSKADIPIVLNSDCHRPDEIVSGFENAVDKLKLAGVNQLWAIIDNRWQEYKFNRKGIIL